MTTLTKTEAEAILERLADKTLSFGQRIKVGDETWKFLSVYEWESHYMSEQTMEIFTATGSESDVVLGHPIMKGRLAKMIARKYAQEEFPDRRVLTLGDFENSLSSVLLYRWSLCEKDNEDLSLQEIFNRIEWRVECGADPAFGLPAGCAFCKGGPAKPSPFADLFIFLKEIGL